MATSLRGAAVALALLATQAADALTPAEVFEKVAPSVWRIRTYDHEGLPLAVGSAVVIGAERLVTNCHVLRQAASFVVGRGAARHAGTLELWDTARDLCRVKAAIGDVPAVGLADTSRLAVDDDVFALGSPPGRELTWSAGLFKGLRADTADRLTIIQTSAAFWPGSSGGGLFDSQGRLIGVTTLLSTSTDAQRLNLAVPAEWVRELPQRHAALRQAFE